MTTTQVRQEAHQRHVRILADAAHLAVKDARQRFPRHETGIRVAVPVAEVVVDESWEYRDQ